MIETGVPEIDRLRAAERKARLRSIIVAAFMAAVLIYAFVDRRAQTATIADLTASLNRRSAIVDYQRDLGEQTTCRDTVINDYRVFATELYIAVIETDPAVRDRARTELKSRQDDVLDRLRRIDELCPPPPPPDPVEDVPGTTASFAP